jgi:hypothetical protein
MHQAVPLLPKRLGISHTCQIFLGKHSFVSPDLCGYLYDAKFFLPWAATGAAYSLRRVWEGLSDRAVLQSVRFCTTCFQEGTYDFSRPFGPRTAVAVSDARMGYGFLITNAQSETADESSTIQSCQRPLSIRAVPTPGMSQVRFRRCSLLLIPISSFLLHIQRSLPDSESSLFHSCQPPFSLLDPGYCLVTTSCNKTRYRREQKLYGSPRCLISKLLRHWECFAPSRDSWDVMQRCCASVDEDVNHAIFQFADLGSWDQACFRAPPFLELR